MDAATDPQKVQSHVFKAKNTFCEHNGHNPIFWCLAFRVLKLTTRKGQNGHFLDGPKMSKIRGLNWTFFDCIIWF
jgi:hypothetical protein